MPTVALRFGELYLIQLQMPLIDVIFIVYKLNTKRSQSLVPKKTLIFRSPINVSLLIRNNFNTKLPSVKSRTSQVEKLPYMPEKL